MNDGEELFIEFSKAQINNAIDEAIKIKRNYITINSLDRDIYFNYIKDKREIIRHLALETKEVKKEFKELTQEEREKRDDFLKQIFKDTEKWRKKKFIERRIDILNRLAFDEIRYGLETTKSKIEQFNIIKQWNLKKSL